MTDAFKDRERGFESKWAHDEDMRFKVMARRNKLLGLWAAGEMGIRRRQGQGVRQGRRRRPISRKPGDEDVFRKLRADFDAAKVARADHVIRAKMEELLEVAGEQVMGEAKK